MYGSTKGKHLAPPGKIREGFLEEVALQLYLSGNHPGKRRRDKGTDQEEGMTGINIGFLNLGSIDIWARSFSPAAERAV